MIELRDLRVAKKSLTICSVAELSIAANDQVAIIGDNGCGKSTLLRVLAGIETDYSGNCDIGIPMHQRCYVHQAPYLFRGSVLSNVVYGLKAKGVGTSEASRLALETLEQMGLSKIVSQSSRHLSGGQRRRVAIARALLLNPKLLLLDEPFSDLDEPASCAVQASLDRLSQVSASTIIVASPVSSVYFKSTRAVRMQTPGTKKL